ncbi:hypothetical protein [Mesorhizobium sp. M1322]|uniref:hypothetical protein n=1 Tax=Mesorhizobium sp. M1322 TaxID=2957081 RepID=UPI003334F34C
MKKRQRSHPPKKKHATRPRSEPVIPLTEEQRLTLARQEFIKSEIHLKEAELLAKAATTPNACVDSAYYAMHHCAAAAILAAGGVGKRKDFPQSHKHIIEAYGKIVEREQGVLAETGLFLIRAQIDRDTADYSLVQSVSNQDASDPAIDARKFVEACDQRWGFRRLQPKT